MFTLLSEFLLCKRNYHFKHFHHSFKLGFRREFFIIHFLLSKFLINKRKASYFRWSNICKVNLNLFFFFIGLIFRLVISNLDNIFCDLILNRFDASWDFIFEMIKYLRFLVDMNQNWDKLTSFLKEIYVEFLAQKSKDDLHIFFLHYFLKILINLLYIWNFTELCKHLDCDCLNLLLGSLVKNLIVVYDEL